MKPDARKSAVAAVYAVLVKTRNDGRITVDADERGLSAALTELAEDIADRSAVHLVRDIAVSLRRLGHHQAATLVEQTAPDYRHEPEGADR